MRTERAIAARRPANAAGITYRQLDYWARTGLVEPSVRGAHGSGSQRLYSFRDILVLKVVKRLLDTGISLQQIRAAVHHLRDRGTRDLAEVTLMSDGVSVYECTSPDEVVDLLQGGQGVFGIALGRVWQEVEGNLAELPAVRAEDGLLTVGSDELSRRRASRPADQLPATCSQIAAGLIVLAGGDDPRAPASAPSPSSAELPAASARTPAPGAPSQPRPAARPDRWRQRTAITGPMAPTHRCARRCNACRGGFHAGAIFLGRLSICHRHRPGESSRSQRGAPKGQRSPQPLRRQDWTGQATLELTACPRGRNDRGGAEAAMLLVAWPPSPRPQCRPGDDPDSRRLLDGGFRPASHRPVRGRTAADARGHWVLDAG